VEKIELEVLFQWICQLFYKNKMQVNESGSNWKKMLIEMFSLWCHHGVIALKFIHLISMCQLIRKTQKNASLPRARHWIHQKKRLVTLKNIFLPALNVTQDIVAKGNSSELRIAEFRKIEFTFLPKIVKNDPLKFDWPWMTLRSSAYTKAAMLIFFFFL